MQQDQFVVLYAGYGDGDGAIQMSCGHVVAGWTQFDAGSGDVITEIAYAEGNVEYRDTTVSLGYAQGISARVIASSGTETAAITWPWSPPQPRMRCSRSRAICAPFPPH